MIARSLRVLVVSTIATACHAGTPRHASGRAVAGSNVHEVSIPTAPQARESPPARLSGVLECTDVPETDPSGSGHDCAASDIVICHERCVDGDAEACAGLVTAGARGLPVELDLLGERLQSLCDARTPLACRSLGQLYAGGAGRPQDDALAARAFESACFGSDALGCVFLAYVLREGQGVPQDLPRAFALLTRWCQQGVPAACNSLGYWYARGTFVEQDYERAFELFLSACRKGDLHACDSVGEAYEKGWHVRQDLHRAEVCYTLNCNYWNSGTSCESAARVRALLGESSPPAED